MRCYQLLTKGFLLHGVTYYGRGFQQLDSARKTTSPINIRKNVKSSLACEYTTSNVANVLTTCVAGNTCGCRTYMKRNVRTNKRPGGGVKVKRKKRQQASPKLHYVASRKTALFLFTVTNLMYVGAELYHINPIQFHIYSSTPECYLGRLHGLKSDGKVLCGYWEVMFSARAKARSSL
jgi:hypothetical protein